MLFLSSFAISLVSILIAVLNLFFFFQTLAKTLLLCEICWSGHNHSKIKKHNMAIINELPHAPLNMIGKALPECRATTVMPDNKIDESFCFNTYTKHKMGVLFFYPLDFTFVCPSELIALDAKMKEFEERNTMVAAASVDSQYSHLAYKNTPREKGGIGQVRFPIISDLNRKISSKNGGPPQ